jgi:hypothetical protein
MSKKRGNPNWGWGTPEPNGAVTPAMSEFQHVARGFNLQPNEYVDSTELRAWASRNKDSKFIPEVLLKAWGLEAESKL